MNVPKNDDADINKAAPPMGPGQQLKKARQRQGLEPSGVASQLHLQTSIVESLEEDDYENLPSPVFVQGYLRNYARLLGLSEDAIVASYQRLLPVSEEQTTLPKQEEKPNPPMNSSHGLMRLITWGVVLILAALVFFWWQNQAALESPEPFSTEEIIQEEPAADIPTSPESSAVFDRQEAAPVFTETEQVDETAADITYEESVETESVESSEVVPQPGSLPLEEAESQVDTVSQQETTESLRLTDVTPEVETLTPAQSPAKTLLFVFDGPCWTEVRDRDGKARIFGVMRSGTQRRLSGQYGPFTVVLGDASTVRLSIDGEPFNIKPFTRGKVARFTLDPEKL